MRVMRQALWEWGYILVIIGGRITGIIQVNDIHLHRVLTMKHKKKEGALMLQKLKDTLRKIP